MRSATPGPKSLSIFRIPRKKNGPCTHPPTAAQRPVRAKSKDDGKLNGKHEAGEEGEGEQEKKGNGEGGRAEGGEREEEEVAEGKDTRCSKYSNYLYQTLLPAAERQKPSQPEWGSPQH
eukprot:GHVT01064907.1.p1 GENE.GHVT01064907.1~~GHVT01064907.1.p1  ORF type:complete len:119 (+),score=28.75 GHVT01064907.1:1731-2087(+)